MFACLSFPEKCFRECNLFFETTSFFLSFTVLLNWTHFASVLELLFYVQVNTGL